VLLNHLFYKRGLAPMLKICLILLIFMTTAVAAETPPSMSPAAAVIWENKNLTDLPQYLPRVSTQDANGHSVIALSQTKGPIVLVKLHSEGFNIELWRATLNIALGHSVSEYDRPMINSIIATQDGHYLLTGSLSPYISGSISNESSYGRYYGFLVKISGETGEILWSIKFAPYSQMNHEITSVIETPNAYIYTTASTFGSYGAFTPSYPRIIAIDKITTDLLYTNLASEAHLGSVVGFVNLLPTTDGGFLALGETNASSAPGYRTDNYKNPSTEQRTSDAYLVKYGPPQNGELPVQWSRTTGTTNADTVTHAVPYEDGYLLLIRYAHNNSTNSPYNIDGTSYSRYGYGRNIFLHQIETNGTTRWIQNYGSSAIDDYAFDLIVTNGKPQIIAHVQGIYSYNTPGGDVVGATLQKNIWLVTFNQGNSPTIFHQSVLGYSDPYYLWSNTTLVRLVSRQQDGTLLVLGYNSTSSIPWIVRTTGLLTPEQPKSANLGIDIQETATTEGTWLHQLLLTNQGPDAATNVSLTYTLPQVMDAVLVSPQPYNYNSENHTITWSLEQLAANTTLEDTYQVETRLKEGETPGVEAQGQAEVASDTPDPDEMDNLVVKLLGGHYNVEPYMGFISSDVSYLETYELNVTIRNNGFKAMRPEFNFTLPKGVNLLENLQVTLQSTGEVLAPLQQNGDLYSWNGNTFLQFNQSIVIKGDCEINDWNKDLNYTIPFNLQVRCFDETGKEQLQKAFQTPVKIIQPDLDFDVSNKSVSVFYDRSTTIILPVKLSFHERSLQSITGNLIVRLEFSNGLPDGVLLQSVDQLIPQQAPPAVQISANTWEWTLPGSDLAYNDQKILSFQVGPFTDNQPKQISVHFSADYAPDSNFYAEHEITHANDQKTVLLEITPSKVPSIEFKTRGDFQYDAASQIVRHTMTSAYQFKNADTVKDWKIEQTYVYLKYGESVDTAETLTRPEINTFTLDKTVEFSSTSTLTPMRGALYTTFHTLASNFTFAQPLSLVTTVTMHYEAEPGGDLLTEIKIIEESFQYDYPAPKIIWPLSGELMFPENGFPVTGWTLPNLTVEIIRENDGAVIATTTSSFSGAFFAAVPANKAALSGGVMTLPFRAVLKDTTAQSALISLRHPDHCWDPNRSEWIGKDTSGKTHSFRFVHKVTGEASTSHWQIPGVYGFWDSTLRLYAITVDPAGVKVIADGKTYYPAQREGNYYIFNIKMAHNVEIVVPCEKNPSSPGFVLIDPDGFVFDSTLGWGNVVPGAKVTCMEYLPATDSWQVWPAHIYEEQINPQIVGANGYFAFFTPAGTYHLQVEDPDGYQTWRSRDLIVISEVVHQNIPYVPEVADPPDVILYASSNTLKDTLDADATTLTVQEGTKVRWVSQPLVTATPDDLLALEIHPEIQIRSTLLNPEQDTRGFDSGLLDPFADYEFHFIHAGVYDYEYTLEGNTASITVLSNEPQAPPADTLSPSTPTALLATIQGYSVQLEWQGAADNVAVTEYVLQRRMLPAGAFVNLATIAGDTTNYLDQATQAGMQYQYGVLARDAAGNASMVSNLVTASLPIPPEPEEPVVTPPAVVETEEEYEKEKPWLEITLPFEDIDDQLVTEAVQYLVMREIIRGRAENRFEPQENLLRGELAVMLHRAFRDILLSEGQGRGFFDVTATDWYAQAVVVLQHKGILFGDGSGYFHPQAAVTGEQLLWVLARMVEKLNLTAAQMPDILEADLPLTRAQAALYLAAFLR